MDSLHKRIKKLNKNSLQDGNSVIYIMSRDQRVTDNHALLAAQKTALKHDVPLLVYFILYPRVKNRLKNQYIWMLEGLKEVESTLLEKNIGFNILVGPALKKYKEIEQKHAPLAFFFDFSPLRGPKTVKAKFAEHTNKPVFLVDTHNIVPVWEASDKEEYAARTIRPKILKKLETYLVEPEEIKKAEKLHAKEEINWNNLIHSIEAEEIENYSPRVKSGEKEAGKTLRAFINEKLESYAELRNDPANDHLSNLSAYYHYGQLSTLRTALEIKKTHPRAFTLPGDNTGSALEESIESYLEESIIRKELSDNFCYYNSKYDSIEGAKEWAKKTLKDHASDKREYLYSFEELKNAKTHDDAWNAAQTEMTSTGKMHGYMRMYWAKKILEWTKTPDEALEFAIKLNDTYQLDGYDPNGYVGCMWSIAGVHDRGWTEREIFGKIRYMNFGGLKRKFDIDTYIKRWEK